MIEQRFSLDRYTLKCIAVAAMLIDHIAAVFLVGTLGSSIGIVYYLCRFIGRTTAPIMCFFIAEGFLHTSSRKKYILRMAVFALISQPFYTLAFYDTMRPLRLSMMFTLLVSLLMLEAWENIKCLPLRIIVAVGCILITVVSDWYIYAPIMVLGCFLMRDRGMKRLIVPLIVSIFMAVSSRSLAEAFMQSGMLVSVGLLTCYNGERGRNGRASKWFFYVFYPAHLFVIYILKLLLRG